MRRRGLDRGHRAVLGMEPRVCSVYTTQQNERKIINHCRNPNSLVQQPSLNKARAFGLLVYLNSTALVMVGGKDPFGFPANDVEILDGDSWKTLADLTPGDHQYSNNPTKSCIAHLQVSRHKVKVDTMNAAYVLYL